MYFIPDVMYFIPSDVKSQLLALYQQDHVLRKVIDPNKQPLSQQDLAYLRSTYSSLPCIVCLYGLPYAMDPHDLQYNLIKSYAMSCDNPYNK
jgi:hypothetical protein